MILALYVHIPFCRTLCPYCDFVREPCAGPVPDVYIQALCREIASFSGAPEAKSLFIGGGTPSLLRAAQLERIVTAVGQRFRLCEGAEITVEANPDDVTPDLISAWRDAGVNRLSLGVQSFDDDALRYLGRRHDAAAARRACEAAAAVFENWSMDLIFGVPPVAAWTGTLDACAAFAPPHIAAYGLTYEGGTPFEMRREEAIDEDSSLALYQQAEEALAGYEHYEISNFARPGFACRHNLSYWRNEVYAGFGTAAYSFVAGVRSRNLTDTADYVQAPGAKEEALRLSGEEIRLETMIQHLRLRAGIEKGYYLERFGRALEDDFGGPLESLRRRGLVEEAGGAVRPTSQGFYLNNEIGLALVG